MKSTVRLAPGASRGPRGISHRALVVALALSLVAACSGGPERPEGWTDESHGRDATPNYAVVFAQDQVKRLDIVIEPADWQAMLDDMTDMFGEFGGGSGGDIPPEVIDACEELEAGDACTVTLDGTERTGTCQPIWEETLGCAVERHGTNLPPELIAACDGLAAGDDCTAPIGTPVPGTCVQGPELFCIPNVGIQACDGKAPGDVCPLPDREGVCQLLGDVTFCAQEAAAPPGTGAPSAGMPQIEGDRDPIWVPCTVEFEGLTWWHVGVRFKGNSTLWGTWQAGSYKLPFKLNTDYFEDDYPLIDNQRFYGFKRLAFANNARDSSYLHEKVAGDLFRENGVPSPHRAFYRIFFDVGEGPVYFGLYTMAEVPDEPMFNEQFGADDGNLYKPTGQPATWQPGLVIDETSFSKKTNEEEADWSDVMAAVEALNADRSDPAAWRAGLEAHLNVDSFLRWLAINTVIEDWDTYGTSPHNYYLYGDPSDGGRLCWIPWDHNESFSQTQGIRPPLPLDMHTVDDRWPLIRFLFDDPVYQETYWAHVEDFAQNGFERDAIRARLQSEHDLIAPYVSGAEGEQAPYTQIRDMDAFDTSLEALFAHVDQRHAAVAEALGR